VAAGLHLVVTGKGLVVRVDLGLLLAWLSPPEQPIQLLLAVEVLPAALVLQVFFIQLLLMGAVLEDKDFPEVTAAAVAVVALRVGMAAQLLLVKEITAARVLLTALIYPVAAVAALVQRVQRVQQTLRLVVTAVLALRAVYLAPQLLMLVAVGVALLRVAQ